MAKYNFLVDVEFEVLGVQAETREAAEEVVKRDLQIAGAYTNNISLTYLGEDEE